jgi:uncharacterized protein YegJ (DUF2314 family)/tetratricopeptide (TPR) repeat protein
MLAFSLRIINGGDVNREVVYALESLVRRYAPVEGSYKALGVGYARLGDMRRAEGFLTKASAETPDDPQILSCFLRIRLAQEKYQEAVEAGQALMESPGARVEDEDVAGLALALLGLHRTAEAKALLEAYPYLDRRNPVVKQARRELKRVVQPGLLTFLGLGGSPTSMLKGITGAVKARLGTASQAAPQGTPRPSKAAMPASRKPPETPDKNAPLSQEKRTFLVVLEYWIFAKRSGVPKWEEIRARLARMYADKEERDRAITAMESLVQKKELTLDHVFKREAAHLFTYPEELIPRNSRRLTDEDQKILSDAQVILRIRLKQRPLSGFDYLVFMTRIVEAAREVTGGVVQDAISHTLWGTEEWKKRTANSTPADMVAAHVQFEALDEGGIVWIHSHGMQKFGLPDMELNGIPADSAHAGLSLAMLIVQTLLKARERGPIHFGSALHIQRSPFSFVMELMPKDDEGHFPAGCLKILPFVSDYDPRSPDTIKHVLRMISSWLRGGRGADRQAEDQPDAPSGEPSVDSAQQTLKERILEAHREARARLSTFKRSFQEGVEDKTGVYAVKVGFPVNGGSYEWMWVTLNDWRGTSLVGHLQNTPLVRHDLRKGCRVELNEQEIFDWVIAEEGNIVNGAFTERALPAP